MKNILILVIAIFIQACSSNPLAKLIPQRGKSEPQVKAVKRIAVVSFETREVTPGGVKGLVLGSSAQQMENTQAVETQLSRGVYEDLIQELKKKGFQVLSTDDVRKNKYYQSIREGSDIIDKLSLNANQRPTFINGIARANLDGLQFNKEERERLLKELNVDALVYSRISYFMPKDFNIVGLGNAYLQPTLTFFMYSAASEDPIWFYLNSAGPKSKEPLGRMRGFEDKDAIERESRLLAQQTINLLLNE